MSFSEWKTYTLGEFAEVQNGYAFKSDDFSESGIPVIKIKNIVSPNINIEESQCFNGEITDRLKQFVIKKNDILISMTGSHINQIASAVGKVGKYKYDQPALLNQRVGKVFVSNKEIGDERYLFYYLSRYETQFELASSAGGSANQANISPTQIKNLKIKLPDLRTQQKIASILSSIDDKIELNNQTTKTLDEIAHTLFNEICLPKEDVLPDGWKWKVFTDEINVVYGKNLPTSNLLKEGYPVFGGNGQIGYHDKFLYKEPQLIIACRGAASGKINQTLPYSFVTNNSLVFEIPKDSILSFPFLKYYCLNQDFTVFVSGSAQPQLTIDGLKTMKLLVPETDVLRKFQLLVSPIEEKMQSNFHENLTLVQLRNSLFPKLMSGEIDVNNSNV